MTARATPPEAIDSVLQRPELTAKVLDALRKHGWVFVHSDDVPKGEVVPLRVVEGRLKRPQ